jgi:hypothetical protein
LPEKGSIQILSFRKWPLMLAWEKEIQVIVNTVLHCVYVETVNFQCNNNIMQHFVCICQCVFWGLREGNRFHNNSTGVYHQKKRLRTNDSNFQKQFLDMMNKVPLPNTRVLPESLYEHFLAWKTAHGSKESES